MRGGEIIVPALSEPFPSMKNNIGSYALASLGVASLAAAIYLNPPGGVRWGAFVEDPSHWTEKLIFLAKLYLWPAAMSFVAIVLYQLQFRMMGGGGHIGGTFGIAVLATGAMLATLRAVALQQSAIPFYVLGVALGYTMMSRVYAIRMKRTGRVSVPWPVWRGDAQGVAEVQRQMQERMTRERVTSSGSVG
jgi:hypothetical protein